MRYFEEFDHPADLALKVGASDLPNLFLSALEGMCYLITGEKIDIESGSICTEFIKCQASTKEDLLVDWLSEFLFRVNVNHDIVVKMDLINFITGNEGFEMSASVSFKTVDPSLLSEIKAVTYHQLNIINDNDGFSTVIVFDV